MKQWLNFIKQEENNGEGGDAGGGESSWRDSLPDDIKGSASLADYKDVAGMAKSHIELQKMMGNSIRVPSSEAGQDDLNKFYDSILEKAPNLMPKPDIEKPDEIEKVLSAIGKPAEASKYELTADLDGYSVSEERMASLKAQAHEAGLTKAQFNKFAGSVLLAESKQVAAENGQVNESRAALQTEWGAAFDDRQSKAVGILEKTGAPAGLIAQAKDGKLGGETLRWAHSLFESIGSEGVEVGGQPQNNGKLTPAEARDRIGEILGNKTHAYWNPSDRNNKEAKAKMVELHRLANGG